jgi:CHASE2 domain-containing sensor protein
MDERPANWTRGQLWLWIIVGGGFLLALAWLLRLPWG